MSHERSFTSPSAIGLQMGATGQNVTDLQVFLRRFGYLQEMRNSGFAAVRDLTVPDAATGTFDNATEEALRSYQQFHGLPVTGELDQATVAEMRKPRCGFPDRPSATGLGRFVAQGNRWDHTNITYRIVNFTTELTQAEIRDAVRQAFDLWGAVVPLTFIEVTGDADILISFVTGDHGDGEPFDGVGNVLAHAYYPPPNGGDIAGDAHFDDAETWTVNVPVPPGGWDLVTIAAHEFGHSLGLDHTNIANALMFPTFPPGSLHRFLAQDDIDGIQSIYGLRTRWNRTNLTAATGAPAAVGDPVGYTWSNDDSQHVVYRGADNHIHELWFTRSAGWNRTDLTAATGAPAAVGDPVGYTWSNDDSQHVVYRGADNHIHELWFIRSAGWNRTDLTAATGAPAAVGDPVGYTWSNDDSQHVVYRGADNHIHELWFTRSAGWNRTDLTAATGAPAAVGDPVGYTWSNDDSQHVVYRGADNHIHELWFTRSAGWNRTDLTAATGAPAAVGDPTGYTWSSDDSQHVVYRGADNHIHELWFTRSAGWNRTDLTAATVAPAAVGDPAGYTWSSDDSQHVVYRGADNHIHELWFTRSAGWNRTDLTAATGAPAAVGDPAGYTWSNDDSQHVVYRGADNHIHELWFK